MRYRRRENGFTLVELLVATTVAAIFTGVALNAYGMFQRGVVETSDGYVRFATDLAKELRCRTRFVRGVEGVPVPCDSSVHRVPRMDVRLRF